MSTQIMHKYDMDSDSTLRVLFYCFYIEQQI